MAPDTATIRNTLLLTIILGRYFGNIPRGRMSFVFGRCRVEYEKCYSRTGTHVHNTLEWMFPEPQRKVEGVICQSMREGQTMCVTKSCCCWITQLLRQKSTHPELNHTGKVSHFDIGKQTKKGTTRRSSRIEFSLDIKYLARICWKPSRGWYRL